MSYRVFIPTAGTGSRLGDLTRYVNKSLVTVANRPVLSHLIEQFPGDVEFVIALGHKGELVREFIELAYPDRVFFVADVSPYEGDGSGLGLTLLTCKKFLQTPFVFCSCDTLVNAPVPVPDLNWMGYAPVEDILVYRTLQMGNDSQVSRICEKGDDGHDLHAYIGLAGINDFSAFWDAMEKGGKTTVETGEAQGLRSLLDKGITGYEFDWLDTGNPQSLANAREALKVPDAPNILDKPDESIWFVNERVIKFSADTGFIKNRVARVQYLHNYVPRIVGNGKHMYSYRKIEGEVFSRVVTLPLFEKLLNTAREFWQKIELEGRQRQHFQQYCCEFYRDKTHQRIRLFYRRFDKTDGKEEINGIPMPTLAELLDQIDWGWLSDGFPGRFHGDFHFENILWTKDKQFKFLDWRQEFGGSLKTGDIYYDLAKLMHGLIISHELIAKDLFQVEWKEDKISYDFHRKQVLVECERLLNVWVKQEGYDLKKIRVLTALVYLNIAGLHHYPYCLLLYALGKKMLKEELEK